MQRRPGLLTLSSRPLLRPLVLLLLLPFLGLTAALDDDDDPKKLLKNRDVEKRLWGVFVLSRDGGDGAEDLLVEALGDKDWEVVEQAAAALIKRGGEDSISPLVTIAANAPARRMRLAAARALAAIDRDAGVDGLVSKIKSNRAADLVDLVAVIGGPKAVAALEKFSGAKDPALARAARLGLGDAGGPEQFDQFVEMLAASDLAERLSGMRGLARTGEDRALAPLLDKLSKRTSDVEERRIRSAIRELIAAGGSFEKLVAALTQVGPQHARLFADIAHDDRLGANKDACVRQLAGMAKGSVSDVRAAAVFALGPIGDGDDLEILKDRALNDDDERVRFHALRALTVLKPEAAGPTVATAIADKSAMVREDAAALAGIHGMKEASAALVTALGDKEWPVVTAAAISLGKLRDVSAREPLAGLLKHRDWRIRGAGSLGLAWLRDVEATDLLIDRLGDHDESVRATIIQALGRITGQPNMTKKGQWTTWWKKNRDSVAFVDSQGTGEGDPMAKYAKGGAYTFYDDLDVVAILSPRPGGDHIEELLKRYAIKHRTASAGSVDEVGLHPFAIAVSNCSGEILPDDIERVEWFVRTGGYLFASCWSLSETVNKAFPGIAEMHHTPTQVMDEVLAEPVREDGVMRGVLRPGTRTRYVLEGSHLISVKDKERFEVLIDSPACASRWGEGNLAGWYTIGHGLVFDSANHFDLQGMKRDVPGSKDERRAMAMDVLGYDHDELRDLDKSGVFKSEKKCAEELEDLSMFRLVTNFVMQKRRAEL